MRSQVLAALLLEDDDWTFTTRLKGQQLNFQDYGSIDAELEGELTITWRADIDAREWGLKEISPTIQSVVGEIRVMDLDSGRMIDTVPVSWPKESTPSAPAPSAAAPAKDLLMHFGGTQEWELLDTEVEYSQGRKNWSMYPNEATLNMAQRTILIQF